MTSETFIFDIMLSITNISTYRFIRLSNEFISELHATLKKETQRLALKGTILLSKEGINLFLAGEKEAIVGFKALLNGFPCFENMTFRESFSESQPFKKMLVKRKKEIIPFGIDTIIPEIHAAPSVAPETLKKWLKERSDLLLLDTRNAFEVAIGSFETALHLDIKHFRDFPSAVQKIPEVNKEKTIVTFCTGGIRCEKASAFLLQAGFNKVYQLQGGILNYFEKCGSDYYQGICFVFDERKALTSSLKVFNKETN
jgi:UPF0176 protein